MELIQIKHSTVCYTQHCEGCETCRPAMHLYIPPSMLKEFKQMVQRGTAFGTQTSPEMKRFADTLLGRISYTSESSQLKPDSY